MALLSSYLSKTTATQKKEKQYKFTAHIYSIVTSHPLGWGRVKNDHSCYIKSFTEQLDGEEIGKKSLSHYFIYEKAKTDRKNCCNQWLNSGMLQDIKLIQN